MSYRLLAGAQDDIDDILVHSAREWGIAAAERYDLLMRAAFAFVGDAPDLPGSRELPRVAGIRAYPLRLGRRLVGPDHRVARPRHIIVYRVAPDGTVEIIGLAHDRMLLVRAARKMQRDAGY